MTDYVVDTNVWVMVDQIIDIQNLTLQEVRCIRACRQWIQEFRDSNNRLAVDGYMTRRILTEYRRNIASKGLARDVLNRLERLPRERLVEVTIEFDEDGFAIVADDLVTDPPDRKFAAVALKFDPSLPIINATETDWEKDKAKLIAAEITVQELCPDYIEAKLKQ